MGLGIVPTAVKERSKNTNSSVIQAASEGAWTTSDHSGALTFYTTAGLVTSEKMRITSAGNVGIGTTTPGTALSVVGTITATGGLTVSPVATAKLRFGLSDSANNFQIRTNSALSGATQDDVTVSSWATVLGGPDYWSIYRMPPGGSTWTSLFTILGTGKVGIGTTDPRALLHMSSADTATFSATANPLNRIMLANTNNSTNNNFADIVFATIDSASSMTDNANLLGEVKLTGLFTDHTPGATSGDLVVTNRNAGAWGETARFTAAHQLGIGTAIPKAPLHVVGLVTYASNAAALTAGLTAGAFYTDGAGAVKVVY